jgi:hypothetical protein
MPRSVYVYVYNSQYTVAIRQTNPLRCQCSNWDWRLIRTKLRGGGMGVATRDINARAFAALGDGDINALPPQGGSLLSWLAFY